MRFRSPTLPSSRTCKPRVERLEERNLLTFFGGYRTIAELYGDMLYTNTAFPNITQLVDYGDSYAKTVGGITTPGGETLPGYDLLAMRVTNRAITGPKPVFLLSAGIHAREISTHEVAMRYLDYLTLNYSYDADVTWLVDHHEIWIAPALNPDGHWHVVLGTQPPYSGDPWLWRKSGHAINCAIWPPSPEGNGYGVDLNRNFDEHWGGPGSSSQPCNQTYRGPSAASEPETVAFQNLMRSQFPDQRGPSDADAAPDAATGIHIDLHTFGGMVIWPWGHTRNLPPNSTGLSAIGQKLATYNGYRAGQIARILYQASGAAGSFGYDDLGIAEYTFELNSDGFIAPYETVDSQLWPENRGALLYAAKIARSPYQLARGPDAEVVLSAQFDSYLVAYSEISDARNGGQNLTEAEFYVDMPPWTAGATPVPLYALDGVFDSPAEAVIGLRSTVGLTPGRHTVFSRGRDANGNWGPVTATFVEITSGGAPGSGGSEIVRGLQVPQTGGWHYLEAGREPVAAETTAPRGDPAEAVRLAPQPNPEAAADGVRFAATTEVVDRVFASAWFGLPQWTLDI